MDIAAKKFTDLTTFEGLDSWPMWAHDGFIYFVSDREDGKNTGITNIWRVPESGGNAQQITTFKSGDVRFPSISGDGKTIVFEHDFGVTKLDVATRKVTPLKIDISAESEESMREVRTFSSRADEYHLSPNGRSIVFSTHGEIFTAPVAGGDLVQITDNPARDKEPVYSPDGKRIAFISDRNGREEIYLVASGGAEDPQRITDLDVLKQGIVWSPDSKSVAFTTTDDKLYAYDSASKKLQMLASSKYGAVNGPAWSPDGKWIAYSKPDQTRNTDIFLIPAAGGQERKVTFDSYSERQPRFSADGKKLYYTLSEGGGGGGGGGGRGGGQLYVVALKSRTKIPQTRPIRMTRIRPINPRHAEAAETRRRLVKDVNIDWDGLKHRTHEITHMPFGVQSYIPGVDSRTLVFVTTEPAGQRNNPVIYTIQDDGRRMSRLAGQPVMKAAAQVGEAVAAAARARGSVRSTFHATGERFSIWRTGAYTLSRSRQQAQRRPIALRSGARSTSRRR